MPPGWVSMERDGETVMCRDPRQGGLASAVSAAASSGRDITLVNPSIARVLYHIVVSLYHSRALLPSRAIH